MRFTEYKAEEAGTLVEYVSAYHTTQLCSRCGKLVPKTLATRIHRCPYCGLVLARDHNSAITVLHRSTHYGASPAGEWMIQEATLQVRW